MGISPMGNSGCFPLEKLAATVMLPNLRCMQGVLVIPNSDMDYRFFNVHTDVYGHPKRVCTES